MENNNVVPDVVPNANQISYPYTHIAEFPWLDAAFKCGYTGNHLTREQCIDIRRKTNIRMPRWLMKDSSRRISRGVYALPELAAHVYANKGIYS